jgi:1-acyl-sn-glycerol-3-phosphate acyltransferase
VIARLPVSWEHMTVFYWVVKAILWPVLNVVFRPWAEGTENVPRTGPAILASNHLSFSDHFFAPLPVPRKVVFLAKSEYFTGRGLKGLISKAFFSGVGQIPVDRTGGAASERALRTGLRVLAAGEVLGIYPEGTRSPDGRLYRGKTGVARLALEGRAPVIPTAMIGGFEFQPPGKLAPRLTVRPGVRFGKPLDFSRYYGLEHDGIVLRAMTDEIMYELMKLSGQEYVDEYAQRAKGRLVHVLRHDRSGSTASQDEGADESGDDETAEADRGAQAEAVRATEADVNGRPARELAGQDLAGQGLTDGQTTGAVPAGGGPAQDLTTGNVAAEEG